MKTKTFKKILKLLKPYTFLCVLTLLCGAIHVFCNLFLPYLFGLSIDYIVGINDVNYNAVYQNIIIIIILIMVCAISSYCMTLINSKIVNNTVKDLRNKAFNQLEVLPLSYIDSKPTGILLNNIITDCDQFGEGLLLAFTQFFTGVLTILGIIVFMFIINVWISLFVILITPLSLFVAKWLSKTIYSSFKAQSECRGRQAAIIDEMIGNQKIVQSYLYEDDALEIFDQNNEELRQIGLKATFISSIVNPSTRIISNIIYAGVAFIGGFLIIKNTPYAITIGALSTLLGYVNQYTKPFNEISDVITELQNSLACAQKVFELIEEDIEVEVDNDDLLELPKEISINHVYFSYTDNPLIEDFNLNIPHGSKVAIVGPTGCGKTTFINLLMRFYDIKSGEILFDGKDITSVTRRNYRKSFGMVLQDTWIPSGTIKDIITMNDKTIPMEDIIEACKKAKILHFIEQLPQGFDTYINENSDGLSAGERQLVCIARVMLKNPDILILDEATSNIDTRTEHIVQSAFLELMQDKTSFVVAHRLSTIIHSDIIIVMKAGKIIEIGNHKELLEQKGFYYDLYHSQFAHKQN